MSEESVYKSEDADYNNNSSKLTVSHLWPGALEPSYHTKCEISFHDNKNNKDFRFTPQEDITAFEMSHVFRLWAYVSSWVYVDVETFVKENGIERHFTEPCVNKNV